jgi:hypothetical protein
MFEGATAKVNSQFALPPQAAFRIAAHLSAKVPAINSYVDDRPPAWVEDIVTAGATDWAENRDHPTLLVEVNQRQGSQCLRSTNCSAGAAGLELSAS